MRARTGINKKRTAFRRFVQLSILALLILPSCSSKESPPTSNPPSPWPDYPNPAGELCGKMPEPGKIETVQGGWGSVSVTTHGWDVDLQNIANQVARAAEHCSTPPGGLTGIEIRLTPTLLRCDGVWASECSGGHLVEATCGYQPWDPKRGSVSYRNNLVFHGLIAHVLECDLDGH